MAEAESMTVEVAYALPEHQILLAVTVPRGTTVGEAIEASGLAERRDLPAGALDGLADRVGVFSKRCSLDRELRPGDRVEIYRPLRADPKEIRRERARAVGEALGAE